MNRPRYKTQPLYHFTCTDHGDPAIQASGTLRPNRHPLLPGLGPIVWLTDQPEPHRDAVGLTSSTLLSCDRMAVRYELDQSTITGLIWWPFVRDRCSWTVVADLERYGSPMHWWITGKPILLDRALIGRRAEGRAS